MILCRFISFGSLKIVLSAVLRCAIQTPSWTLWPLWNCAKCWKATLSMVQWEET